MARSPLAKSLASAANSAVSGGLKVTSWGFKNISQWVDNDKTLEDFTYDEMNSSRSIRLLKVEDRDGPRLVCTLATFRLTNAPPYHALSYTWGDPFGLPNLEREAGIAQVAATLQQENYTGAPHKIVKCNGKRLRIGLNLFEALEQLSTSESSDLVPHQYIWADAICIDQRDAAEKDQQMLLMGEIYASAATVIVWLGKEQAKTAKAIEAITKLSKLQMSQLSTLQGKSLFLESTYQSLGIETIDVEDWYAFFGFNRRGWFNRVWVVQELFFAKNHIYVVGNLRVESNDIFKMGVLLKLSGWAADLEALLLPDLWSRIGDQAARPGAASEIYLMKQQAEQAGVLTPTNILMATRARLATNPLDHVFAMLNVIAVGLGVKTQDLPVKIDSSAKLDDVLQEATLMCMKHDKRLSILSARQEQSSRGMWQSKPSWVVDWTKRLSPMPLSILSRDRWTPCGSMRPELADSTVKNILKFRGIKLCTVTAVSEHGQRMGSIYTTSSVCSRRS
jgi:hypothetical protein